MRKKTLVLAVEWVCRWIGFDYATKHGFAGRYLQLNSDPIQHTLGVAKQSPWG